MGEIINEMCVGKRNLFIHGGAGTGKSYLIKQMQEKRVNAIYAAPSGIAALNINGTTIHSLFNLQPSVQFPDNFNRVWNKLLLEKADTLLIDEISMVRCDVFDKIDQVLRGIRNDDRPFGGIRIIIVGDLFQLGAIATENDKRHLRDLYPDAHGDYSFYKADCFNRADFALYELTYNYRQADDDAFALILDAVRKGISDEAMLAILNTRCKIDPPTDQYYYITIDNTIARSINTERLNKLPDTITLSKPVVKVNVPVPYLADRLEDCPMSQNLYIKKDMKIMFVKNDSQKNGKRWVNGTIGYVSKKNYVNNQLESVIVRVESDIDNDICLENEYTVVREHYRIVEPIYNTCIGGIDIVPVADVYQFPFQAAWAMTIHKAQGLTLDKVIIDLSYGAFAPGQVYVALSRAKRLSDLWLKRLITKHDIKVSKHTQAFYESMKAKSSAFESAPVELQTKPEADLAAAHNKPHDTSNDDIDVDDIDKMPLEAFKTPYDDPNKIVLKTPYGGYVTCDLDDVELTVDNDEDTGNKIETTVQVQTEPEADLAAVDNTPHDTLDDDVDFGDIDKIPVYTPYDDPNIALRTGDDDYVINSLDEFGLTAEDLELKDED